MLYVPPPLVSSYCTGTYRSRSDDKGRVQIMARTENALMKMGSIFTACRNGNASHIFSHVQFGHHYGCILVPLPAAVLEDIVVPGLYDVI